MIALLVLLALSLALYVRERLDSRREDALWETRRKRLAALNKNSSILASSFNYTQIDVEAYEFRPGAMWIVSDPMDVQVLSPAG